MKGILHGLVGKAWWRGLHALYCLASAPLMGGAEMPASTMALVNGDFQQGPLGAPPMGWVMPELCLKAGFQCAVAEDPALPARRCAILSQTGGEAASFGNLIQTIPAAPYRGQRIRLTGRLRMEPKDGRQGQGQMWLRVDRPGGAVGFFDNMGLRPVRERTWTSVEIVGDVAKDSESIALGALLSGDGRLWIGPMTVETLGATPDAGLEGPRPVTRRGLANLEAFARAFAYVRFFHPTDEAVKADWNRLAIEGVRAVEGAESPAKLATRLQAFFAPYAPGAQFLEPGRRPGRPVTVSGATLAVRWIHSGFGQGDPGSVYLSTREWLPLGPSGRLPWPDPLASAALDLGGGVRLLMPSVLRATLEGTLPRATGAPASPRGGTLPEPTAGPGGTLADRGTRLGSVVLAWGVIRHFHPFAGAGGTDWAAELPRALSAAALDPGEKDFCRTLRLMVAALKDGHGEVVDLIARATPAVNLVILDGAPIVRAADHPEVVPGSRILTVDGDPLGTRLAGMRKEISAASKGWMQTRLAQEVLAGDPATPARITFRKPSGTEAEAILPRDPALCERLQAAMPPAPMCEPMPGIRYVDLSRISDQDLEAALPDLARAKGVVFDLRRYPRVAPSFLQHLSDRPLLSPRWEIPVVTRPDGKGWSWSRPDRWRLEPRAPRLGGKVAFLTGGGAISYAESCLGIAEAYRLGTIVGEPTAGTNGNVNHINLPGGLTILWTGMRVRKHDGSRHHGVGIRPTVAVKPTVKGLAEGRDEVLEAGLKVVAPSRAGDSSAHGGTSGYSRCRGRKENCVPDFHRIGPVGRGFPTRQVLQELKVFPGFDVSR